MQSIDPQLAAEILTTRVAEARKRVAGFQIDISVLESIGGEPAELAMLEKGLDLNSRALAEYERRLNALSTAAISGPDKPQGLHVATEPEGVLAP